MTPVASTIGTLTVIPFPHPQGCRSYLVVDEAGADAVVIDPHLDLVDAIAAQLRRDGLALRYVVDTHTHADHPSGAARLADSRGGIRIAHAASQHAGVTMHPDDGEALHFGSGRLTVRHAPGHTPDHVVLVGDGVLFSGDTLLIGAVARTDFLGGDAGQLFDSLHRVLDALDDDVVVYPGHDYAGRIESTLGHERVSNPWLHITDRDEFVRALTADPPAAPANMDALLRLNREGQSIAPALSAGDAVAHVRRGGASSVIDVRTPLEVAQEHVGGAVHIPLDELAARADEVRKVAAPRLLLCRSGKRAETARRQLEGLGIGGLSVVEGGIIDYAAAGGLTEKAAVGMSLERQVRIAAGLLVVVGVGLGWFVHPAWLGLAAFVGAGLVFAGVTDRCGMALVLAKLPWNRFDTSPAAAAAGGGSCAAKPPPSGGGCAAKPPSP